MFRELYNKYSTQLQQLDLSQKETSVYLSLIANGSQTAHQIAQITKLNRTTVYVQLEELIVQGLVSLVKEGKKTFYVAESPEKFNQVVDKNLAKLKQQQELVTDVLPDLLRAYSEMGALPSIRMFYGFSGVDTLRLHLLDSTDKMIKSIISADRFYSKFENKVNTEFTTKRRKLKIKSKIIYTLEEGDDFVPFKDQTIKRADFKKFNFGTEVYVSEHAVAIIALEGSMFGVLIVNDSIAKTMDTFFENMWNQLG